MLYFIQVVEGGDLIVNTLKELNNMKISTGLTKSSFIALSVLYSATSSAALAEKQGFTGEVAVIAGYATQTSNMNTEGEKKKTPG